MSTSHSLSSPVVMISHGLLVEIAGPLKTGDLDLLSLSDLPHLVQCAHLDLADSLFGHTESIADLLQCFRFRPS